MMKKISIILFALVFCVMAGCQLKSEAPSAKYVFLFIGDGMGVNQVMSSELYLSAKDSSGDITKLHMSNFPVQSFVSTHSANSLITCSSASGTAMASGFKTNNGYLNVDPTQTVKFETIAEKAQKAGYKIGILSSVAIDHATPASFYAHQNSRNMYYEISMELPESGFDFFGGGGFHYPQGKLKDQPNAFDHLKAKGYTYINTQESFDSLKQGDAKVMAVNPQTYPQGEFYWEIDQKEGALSLADFTKKGIEVLDNPKGFFMMVEGGKIDWACHSNDIATSIHETLAFDEAVAQALYFYQKHPHETLILVTADHETGGIGLGNTKPLNLGVLQHQHISIQEFTRKVVQYKSEKPDASFEDLLHLIEEYFGLGNATKGLELSEAERKYLYQGYQMEFVGKLTANPDDDYLETDKDRLISERVIVLMSQKAGIGWTSKGHTGTQVPIRALGVGQDYFKSQMDNTDIPKVIERLMGL